MTGIILILQILTLVAVACITWKGRRWMHALAAYIVESFTEIARRRPPPTLPEPLARANAHCAQSPDTGIWQELHRAPDGTLHLHQWVREGSPAWRHAYDAPGVILRRAQEVVEGIQ